MQVRVTNYQLKKRKITAEINVVPYIDVMLVLLIIFMVTAPFVTQGVAVDLPQTQEAKSVTELAGSEKMNFIIVQVDPQGRYALSLNNGAMNTMSTQDMLIKIKAELLVNPNSTVLVGGDAKTQYSNVVVALDILNQAGVTKVGLMTDPIGK